VEGKCSALAVNLSSKCTLLVLPKKRINQMFDNVLSRDWFALLYDAVSREKRKQLLFKL
jgi:hypothetical protein